ncbi:Transposable element Tcb2 transposase [Labeo rohita]|uniref:Transposable element Tcb2 transposase n=1 Tax=Labeo rohita TaxID=84645 RepID=A0ABQ8MHK0_LABRO|nr:Transposable element Tcb2 transposase [Labeo rohita]
MGKTADLTVVQKTIIDTLHKEGKPQTFIAKEAGCSQSVVSKQVNRKLSGRKKCGRKRCTTNQENRSLERLVKQNRFKNLGELHKEWTKAGVKASRATTHRRVKEFGYSCHIPLVKPLLNHRQCQRRLTWAKEKKKWTVAQWSKVLFSDESKFCITFGNQGPRVWRKGGKAHSPSCQDLAPAHTAKSTKRWLNDHGVGVLDWPANSPDLNPIENLWGIVKRKMRNKRPKNADELKATVKETWASIPPQQCHRLITSMPRRIEAVNKAKGAPTNLVAATSSTGCAGGRTVGKGAGIDFDSLEDEALMETQDVASAVVSLDEDSERRLSLSSQAGGSERENVSVAASKAGDSDSVSVVVSPADSELVFLLLSHPRRAQTQNGCFYCCLPCNRLQTQNGGDLLQSLSLTDWRLRTEVADSEQGVSFGRVPLSLSDEEEIAIWRFSISEVLSFPGFVPKVVFLRSKRCLAVVLASSSDGVGQFAYASCAGRRIRDKEIRNQRNSPQGCEITPPSCRLVQARHKRERRYTSRADRGVQGAMAGHGARGATAERTVRDAMAGQGARGATAEHTVRGAMADRGAMAEYTVQAAMVDQGARGAMAENTVQVAMVDQGARGAMAKYTVHAAMADHTVHKGNPPTLAGGELERPRVFSDGGKIKIFHIDIEVGITESKDIVNEFRYGCKTLRNSSTYCSNSLSACWMLIRNSSAQNILCGRFFCQASCAGRRSRDKEIRNTYFINKIQTRDQEQQGNHTLTPRKATLNDIKNRP